MDAYVADWLNLVVRWLHFVAGVAWIGASFYFVWLDNHLRPPQNPGDAQRGVHGELWSVHGGGFYHSQKYLTGPKGQPLAKELHWFKWEAYTTWLSGMALLAIIYWIGARVYLIDKDVLDLTPPAAIAISVATVIVGWLVYDAACKLLGNRPQLLSATISALLVLAAWGLYHVFSARAAYIHVGAMIGTIMVANVLLVIIPGQRSMVDAIRAGREPDPRAGERGKIRSIHNTYLTLPVLFIMISNHYPMTYGNPRGWLVLAVLSAAGVLIRHFFVLSHKNVIVPALPAAAAALLIGLAVILAPRAGGSAGGATPAAIPFERVASVVAQRCAVCHAEKPTQPGFVTAPDGVVLDTPARIRAAEPRIYQQAVRTSAMPLGNATHMTAPERAELGKWIESGASAR